MKNIYWSSRMPRLLKGPLALFAVFCLMLVLSACGGGNTVHVYDNAGVLNQNSVQNEASSLPDPMDIYTTNSFNGTKAQFDQTTVSKLGNNANLIVMAIDTVQRHLAIVRGSSVPLSNSQIQSAVNTFARNFGNNDYTGATVATIDSLRNSLGSTSVVPGAGGIFSGLFGTLCCVGLLILVAAALFGIFRSRRRFGLFGGRPQMRMPYQQPYNQPYPPNQGYPPNYYGPGYNQGPGINPWVAGGLGAAGGGLIGYELGKEAGESESQQQGNAGGWAGGSGDFGGGGGSGGGDFGGGGGGGGGDFGGGASGDFGGGGGGGDFGGGGGGNF